MPDGPRERENLSFTPTESADRGVGFNTDGNITRKYMVG